MTRYSEGDSVYVRPLKKSGIVTKVLSEERFQVAVGDLSIRCACGDLAPSPQTSKASPKESSRMVPANPAPAPKSIDLHGMSADDAVRAVEHHLNRVILSGAQQTKIIHGLGTGKVRSAVHSLLSSLRVVRAFRLNDANPGETDVYF